MINGLPETLGGYRIVVCRPTTKTVKRTWRERLFSRPWRPLKKTKVVIVPSVVPTNEAWKIGDVLWVGVEMYENLKKVAA